MNSARFIDIETENPSSEARGRVVVETSRRLNTENTRKIPYIEQAPISGYDEEIERGFNPVRGSNYLKFAKHERHNQVPHGKGNSPSFRLKNQSESPRRNMLLKDSSTSKRYWDSEKYNKDSESYESDGSPYSEQIEPENYFYPEPIEHGKFHPKHELDPDNFFSHKDNLRVRHIYKDHLNHDKHRYKFEDDESDRYKKIIPERYGYPEVKERSKVLIEQVHRRNDYYPKGNNRDRYPYVKTVEPGNHYYREPEEYYSEADEPGDYHRKNYYYPEANEGNVQERRAQRCPFKEHVETESFRASYEYRFEPNRDGYIRNQLIELEKPMHHSLLRSRKLQYQEQIFPRFAPDGIYQPLFPASHENRRIVHGNFFTSPYEHEDQIFGDRRSDPSFLRPQPGKREFSTSTYEPHKRIRKDELNALQRKSSKEAYGFRGFDFNEERTTYDDDSYYETEHDLDQIRFKPKWRSRTGHLMGNEYPEAYAENVEENWTPEPYESSEEFKQKVDKAFLLYSKSLNISQSVRRKYLMQGKAGYLYCIVCRRLGNEFPDTETLAKHALFSREVECRVEHLALHKAICLIMGWDTCRPSKSSEWEPIPLSVSEAWTHREDLILWPPIVIIRNLPFSITPPEKISSLLRGKGLINGKMNVSLGLPPDQTVIVLKFLGTFTGLDSAERVNRYFADSYRGRGKYHVRAKGGGSKRSASEEDVYGYMGTASDLELLDGQTRKQVVIKSKKCIMDLANEPVKPNIS